MAQPKLGVLYKVAGSKVNFGFQIEFISLVYAMFYLYILTSY